jgi:hypothetical protein
MNTVVPKIRMILMTLTLAGGTLLTATAGGCYSGPKDISAESARKAGGDPQVDAADYTMWRANFGAGG